MGNYDQRKQEEEKRLQNILERVNTLSLELSPPGPSTAAGSVACVRSLRRIIKRRDRFLYDRFIITSLILSSCLSYIFFTAVSHFFAYNKITIYLC